MVLGVLGDALCCEGVYKPVETYFQSTRTMVLGVLGVALCVSGWYLHSGEFYCTS